MSLLLALQAPAPIAVVSVQALPLGGTVALTNAIALDSTRALPLGGSVVLTAPIVFSSIRGLPLGGSVTLVAPIAMGSSASMPFGGSATFDSGASPSAKTPAGAARIRRAALARAWTLYIELPRSLFVGADLRSTVDNPRRSAGRFTLPSPQLLRGQSRPAPLQAWRIPQWSLHDTLPRLGAALKDGRSVAKELPTLEEMIARGLLEVFLE